MLDFSGRHEGGNERDVRYSDHREIYIDDVDNYMDLNTNQNSSMIMIEMIDKLNLIRMSMKRDGLFLNFINKPTPQQIRTINKIISYPINYVEIERDDSNGSTIESKSFDILGKQSLSQIKNYFLNELTEGNYKMANENFDAEYLQLAQLTDEQIEKLAGNLLEGYEENDEIEDDNDLPEDSDDFYYDTRTEFKVQPDPETVRSYRAKFRDDSGYTIGSSYHGDVNFDYIDQDGEVVNPVLFFRGKPLSPDDVDNYISEVLGENGFTVISGSSDIQPSIDEPTDSTITQHGKQYQTKKFGSVDATNKFLQTHPEYGVIQSNEDDTEVHVARMDESEDYNTEKNSASSVMDYGLKFWQEYTDDYSQTGIARAYSTLPGLLSGIDDDEDEDIKKKTIESRIKNHFSPQR